MLTVCQGADPTRWQDRQRVGRSAVATGQVPASVARCAGSRCTPELEQAELQALGKRRGATLTWWELCGGRSGPWR